MQFHMSVHDVKIKITKHSGDVVIAAFHKGINYDYTELMRCMFEQRARRFYTSPNKHRQFKLIYKYCKEKMEEVYRRNKLSIFHQEICFMLIKDFQTKDARDMVRSKKAFAVNPFQEEEISQLYTQAAQNARVI